MIQEERTVCFGYDLQIFMEFIGLTPGQYQNIFINHDK